MRALRKADVVGLVLGKLSCMPQQAEGRAFAPSNIALCKYWGKRNEELNLPITSSLSVSLGHLGTTTLITMRSGGVADEILLNGAAVPTRQAFARGVTGFLNLFRPNPSMFYRVETVNTVPTAAGLASSASGFAALTLAVDQLCRWKLTSRQLSILARLGSGSAARSVYRGFVEWKAGANENGMDSFAVPVRGAWPELRLGLVKVSTAEKAISSREAMKRTRLTSAFYEAWPVKVAHDLLIIKEAIAMRDFKTLGQTTESNALAMHATGLAAWPPVLFWLPESVAVMHRIWALREAGLALFFTMDAGPNVKLLFLAADTPAVQQHFPGVEIVTPFAGK
jgi:diphosphomevalonate decarboxylase